MSSETNHEIAVIGAGPAGSMVSAYLSAAGFDTCVIEKRKFPREVLCGEFLSNEVIAALKEINLFEKFLSYNPNKISEFTLVNKRNNKLYSSLDFDAFAMKRSVFDSLLLEYSAGTGTKLYQPAEVISLEKDNNKFVLKIKSNRNEETIIKVDFVIAAYGRKNILDKKLNRSFVNAASGFNGVKFHVPNSMLNELTEEEIRIYLGNDIYCGVNQVSEEETTLCFLEKRNGEDLSPRERLEKLLSQNEMFGNLFKSEFKNMIYRLPVYGTGNIYFGKRNVVENGVFMIGDAAGIIAPLSGDGIGMAIQSAKLLSSIIIDYKAGKINLKTLSEIYEREWNRLFSKRIKTALSVQKIFLNKFYEPVGLYIAKTFPFVMHQIIRSTRGT